MTKTAAIITETIGRKRIISRAEMQTLLLSLHASGLDLTNAYVHESQQSPEIAAAAWAKAVQGITVISASMDGRGLGHADGWVRYDQPGSMHPMQKADVMFVSEDIERGFSPRSYAREFMGRHAFRTLIVRAEPEPEPEPKAAPAVPQTETVECTNGHRWDVPLPLRSDYDYQCPKCGEWAC